MYDILPYTYNQAKKLGVEVKPSTKKGKKIDVYKEGKKIVSVGALNYGDYPHYLEQNKQLANQKRKAYKARHKDNTGVAGFYASNLLW